MKNFTLLFLLLCGTLCFSACSDDDESPLREEALMNKRWQITALNAETFLGPFNFYEDFSDCQLDNFVEFRSGGVLLVDEGATKCNTTDAQQVEGSWSLNGDVLVLKGIGQAFDLPLNDLEVTVTELTETSLTAEFNVKISGFNAAGTVSMETM